MYIPNTTNTTTDDDNQQQRTEQTEQQQPPKTLPEILAARIRKLEREQAENAEQSLRKTEGRRADQLTAFEVHYEKAFPDVLRDALGATIGYDTTREIDGDPDEEPERGPYARFNHQGDHWIIRRGSYYGDHYWQLHGPVNYYAKISLDYDYADSPAGPLLDALNAFPAWLANMAQRDRDAAQAAADKAAADQQRRDEHPLYAYVSGDLRGDHAHLGMLHCGSRLWIVVETPETGEHGGKIERHRAELIDWDGQWLLINLDDDETIQRLIPIARVVSIQPRD